MTVEDPTATCQGECQQGHITRIAAVPRLYRHVVALVQAHNLLYRAETIDNQGSPSMTSLFFQVYLVYPDAGCKVEAGDILPRNKYGSRAHDKDFQRM